MPGTFVLIARKSPQALRLGKESFYAQTDQPLADAYATASDFMVDNMLMADAQEGVGAFLNKRKPEWKLS